jgi:lysophospholipase L1-like esterase
LILTLAILLMGTLAAGCTDRICDYVALGSSIPAGWGVDKSYVDYYAELIEQDLGVQVELHNFSRSGRSTTVLLDRLRKSEELRDAIREAEVVTIWTGWNDLWKELELYGREECGGEDNLDCIREETANLKTDFDAIFDEILSLTSVQDTHVLVAETSIPVVKSWKYKGWFDTLQEPCYEEWRAHMVESAEARSITVAYTYHALNGPGGDEPVDGRLLQSDGIHFTEEGHRLVAELHRAAGYGPLEP